jgi:hypothetical protein
MEGENLEKLTDLTMLYIYIYICIYIAFIYHCGMVVEIKAIIILLSN